MISSLLRPALRALTVMLMVPPVKRFDSTSKTVSSPQLKERIFCILVRAHVGRLRSTLVGSLPRPDMLTSKLSWLQPSSTTRSILAPTATTPLPGRILTDSCPQQPASRTTMPIRNSLRMSAPIVDERYLFTFSHTTLLLAWPVQHPAVSGALRLYSRRSWYQPGPLK